MAIFALQYRYSSDIAARDTHRPAHREFVRAQENVLLSGPVTDPDGALILVYAASADEVAQQFNADPFYVEKVVAERTVRHYAPNTGALTSAIPSAAEQ